MNEMKIRPIGKIENENGAARIVLLPEYREGLEGLAGYSHVQVLWWADACDNEAGRKTLAEEKPYKKGPDRPNLIITHVFIYVNTYLSLFAEIPVYRSLYAVAGKCIMNG